MMSVYEVWIVENKFKRKLQFGDLSSTFFIILHEIELFPKIKIIPHPKIFDLNFFCKFISVLKN